MKDFGARFGSPMPATRRRGARLLEAHSPKLNRRVRFFDHLAFCQWIRLEADPGVLKFCERPARVDTEAAPSPSAPDGWRPLQPLSVRSTDSAAICSLRTCSSTNC
jgi:hypothetical protein